MCQIWQLNIEFLANYVCLTDGKLAMHLPFPSLQMKFALWIPQNTCLQQEVNQQSQYRRVFLLAGICLEKKRMKTS